MILRHRAGEQEFQDLQNWEDFEEVEFNAWREADEEGVDRFAGNEDDHQIEMFVYLTIEADPSLCLMQSPQEGRS